MSRHSSHLCLSNQLSPSLRSCWKKISLFSREQQCQWTTSPACRNSVWRVLTSPTKGNITNNLKGLQWVLLSVQLLPIYLWRTLNKKQQVQLHTHLTSGKDMWMTPLPSWSHPIEEPSWTTSTLLTSISSLPVKNKEKMGPYHSWMC